MQGGNDRVRAAAILFVEDEILVRKVTQETLESAGYRVLAAKTAAEAAGMFDQEPFRIDLLLTDVVLPDENGRVLATNLLRTEPRLRVLFVSGYPEEIRTLQDSGESCLPKPYSSDSLLGKIEELIGHYVFRAKEPLTMRDVLGA